MIVTPMILLAYAVEGRKRVQATSLDPLFSFVGAALLIASGGMVIEYNIPVLKKIPKKVQFMEGVFHKLRQHIFQDF